MKLRNKKTGRIVDIDFIYPDTAENFHPEYKLKDFIKEWDDVEPSVPLIKDEKIRKAVRAWADANDYKKCAIHVLDYDRAGVYCENGITSFVSCESNLPITFFSIDLDIETDKVYTITELCGEDDE